MMIDDTKPAPDVSGDTADAGRRDSAGRDLDVHQSPAAAELGSDSAPRRTLLAAERTYLAWLRTGLGAIAVSVAIGRLAPALLGGSHPRLGLLGAGYGVLGVFFIVYAIVRAKRLDSALAANARVGLDWWALVIVTVLSLGLAVATIVMVLAEV